MGSYYKNSMEDIWFATVDGGKDYVFHTEAVKMRRRVIAPYRQTGQPKDWQETTEGNFRDTAPSNFWDDITIPYWSMPENTDHPTQKPEKAAEPTVAQKQEREEEKPTPTAPPRAVPEATLATLTPAQKTILEAIPDDGTLSTDAIFALEHPHADLMAALTMLEIMGLVQKLPGALYTKA